MHDRANERAAFRDLATGRNKNREQAPEENDDSGRGGRGRGRGRGGPRRGGDRHSRTGIGLVLILSFGTGI